MNSLIINTPVQAGIHTFNLRTEQRPKNLDKINSAVLDAGFLERTEKWFLELDINLVNGCINQYSIHCKTLTHFHEHGSLLRYWNIFRSGMGVRRTKGEPRLILTSFVLALSSISPFTPKYEL